MVDRAVQAVAGAQAAVLLSGPQGWRIVRGLLAVFLMLLLPRQRGIIGTGLRPSTRVPRLTAGFTRAVCVRG